MAVLLKYMSVVPAALRIGLAGGATYGTVKADIWSDSSKSREKLEHMKQAVQKEIRYEKEPGADSAAASLVAVSNDPRNSPLQYAVRKWNSGVMATCNAIATADGSGIKSFATTTYQKISERMSELSKKYI